MSSNMELFSISVLRLKKADVVTCVFSKIVVINSSWFQTFPFAWWHEACSSVVEEDDGCIGSSGKLLFLWPTPIIMQNMLGNIPYMFDYWADPVVHLLLQKSSMSGHTGGKREIERQKKK